MSCINDVFPSAAFTRRKKKKEKKVALDRLIWKQGPVRSVSVIGTYILSQSHVSDFKMSNFYMRARIDACAMPSLSLHITFTIYGLLDKPIRSLL